MKPHERLAQALRAAEATAVVPYLTGGYPDMTRFVESLDALVEVSPALEVGIPFSDPMADGATIQESSRQALAAGTTLDGVITGLEKRANIDTPLVIMSYLNPLLAYGVDRLIPRLVEAGVCGLVLPDLPFEEASIIAEPAQASGMGIVQLVTPLTDRDRLQMLCKESQGFVYAVTMTGTTGGVVSEGEGVSDYLDRVREASSIPVLAGFGVRSAQQVRKLAPHCDGVIVGSAIVEKISRGEDPVAFVQELLS